MDLVAYRPDERAQELEHPLNFMQMWFQRQVEFSEADLDEKPWVSTPIPMNLPTAEQNNAVPEPQISLKQRKTFGFDQVEHVHEEFTFDGKRHGHKLTFKHRDELTGVVQTHVQQHVYYDFNQEDEVLPPHQEPIEKFWDFEDATPPDYVEEDFDENIFAEVHEHVHTAKRLQMTPCEVSSVQKLSKKSRLKTPDFNEKFAGPPLVSLMDEKNFTTAYWHCEGEKSQEEACSSTAPFVPHEFHDVQQAPKGDQDNDHVMEDQGYDPWVTWDLLEERLQPVQDFMEISQAAEDTLFEHIRDILGWKEIIDSTWDMPSFKEEMTTLTHEMVTHCQTVACQELEAWKQ